MHIEDELEETGIVPPFRDNPDWLILPVARREKAVRRALAMHAYDHAAEPGLRTVETMARPLGVSVRQFYDLRKRWEADRTIFSMVPYAGRIAARNPKLDPAVQIQLTEGVASAAGAVVARTPRAILAKVLEDWPRQRFPPPTEQTIRSYIAAHLQTGIGPGRFTLNVSDNPQEEAESAERHGDVLVIDHVSPELFIELPGPDQGGGHGGEDDENEEPLGRVASVRPTVTLAIDLLTSTVAGFAIGLEAPHPGLVVEALLDAQRRTAATASTTESVKPRLVLATTSGKDWRSLVRMLADADVKATIRWSPRLRHGGPARRLIGKTLGDVPLWARKSHAKDLGQSEFDPDRHPLVTLEQAGIILAEAVRRLAAERLPDGTEVRAIGIWTR